LELQSKKKTVNAVNFTGCYVEQDIGRFFFFTKKNNSAQVVNVYKT